MAAFRNGDGSSLLDLDTGFLYSGLSLSVPSIDLHGRLQGVHMSGSATAVEYTGLHSSTQPSLCHSASMPSPSLALKVQSPLTRDCTPEPSGGLAVPVEVLSHPEIVVEYTGDGSSTLPALCRPASVLSPSLALKVQSPSTRDRTPEPNSGLTAPAEVRSSTPCEGGERKRALDSLPNLSLIDLLSPNWSPLSAFTRSPPCAHAISLLDSTPERRSPALSVSLV